MEKLQRGSEMRDDLDLLESIADKHDLLLSDNLINFANDVWAIAYKQGMQDEALAREHNKGKQMKKIEIDIDELLAEAVKHMEDEHDVRWSIGMALQELYWDKMDGWAEVQQRLTQLYLEQAKRNTYS